MVYQAHGPSGQLKWRQMLGSGPSGSSGGRSAEAKDSDTDTAPCSIFQPCFPQPFPPFFFLYLSLLPAANHFLLWNRVPELSRFGLLLSQRAKIQDSCQFHFVGPYAKCGALTNADPPNIWFND